jgi:hypothetical protein
MTTVATVMEPMFAQDATEQRSGQAAAATSRSVWNWGGTSAASTPTFR